MIYKLDDVVFYKSLSLKTLFIIEINPTEIPFRCDSISSADDTMSTIIHVAREYLSHYI